MNKLITIILMALLSVVAQAKNMADSLEIENIYVRLMPPGSQSTAAFGVLKNVANQDLILVSGESEVAGRVEVHGHQQEGGVFKMVQLKNLTIPKGGSVELKPGGNHIMLMQLKNDLKENQQIKISLVMSDKSKKTISATVKSDLGQGHHHH